MTSTNLKFVYHIITTLLFIELTLTIFGPWTFGQWIGDVIYFYGIIASIIIWGLIVYIKSPFRNEIARKIRVLLSLGMVITPIYFVLQLSFFFGGEEQGMPF
ncbi:MAG: hypothetical protein KDC84_11545 [Crocinitomicaceae bacterium]|nr:hypothetical protein [Crocinitomicaceae bacterium]